MDRIAMIVQIPVQMKTVTRPPARVTQIAPMTGVDSIVRVSKKCLKALPIVHNVPLGFTALTAINIVLPHVMDIDVTSLRDCVTDVLQVGTAINVIVEETAMRVDVVFLATATRAHRGTGVRTVYKYACTTVVKNGCDRTSGVCRGCETGWHGDQCDTKYRDPDSGAIAGVVIGSAVVGSAITLLVVFVVIYVRRRQAEKKPAPRDYETPTTPQDEPYQGMAYVSDEAFQE
ncbi:hypothetical protein ScPMuIL_006689 [Solemya velum]